MKAFVCDVCNSNFSSKSTLNRHLRNSHNGEKYKCRVCGKEFKQEERMKAHEKKH